jgi:magnesium-transporting ATPase (P-type)
VFVLQLIGTYATYIFASPLDAFSTVSTLAFVLLVTSIKEGYEDFQRYKSDYEENSRIVTLVKWDQETGVAQEVQVQTQTVKAGDVIKMTGTTQVPADLILILTSNYADANQCYIETANIDGETNLKLREAPSSMKHLTQEGGRTAEGNLDKKLFTGSFEFEQPNKDIHNFTGAYHLPGGEEPVPLGPQNMLLRSSLFSNTDWAYGVAVYTGQETKIQMNNKRALSKVSKLEGYMNLAIIVIFICQVLLVSASVISIYGMGFQDFSSLPYIYPNGSGTGSVLPLWLEQW